jgi:hypothetical protein
VARGLGAEPRVRSGGLLANGANQMIEENSFLFAQGCERS